jgi:hypothetical protein
MRRRSQALVRGGAPEYYKLSGVFGGDPLAAFLARGLGAAGLAVLLMAAALPARADVDSEHLFGFTEGTDIGTPFLPEGELETIGRFGRNGGNYSALSATASLKYPLTDWFRVAPSITFTRFDISGVTDFEDRNVIALERLALEFRWRPFDREKSLFGLTFVATPFVGFIDDVTGAPGDAWGGTFIVVADQAVIADRLYLAVNLSCDFDRVRDYATGLMADGSELGLNVAAAARLFDGIYLGGEARYLRAFDGLGFGNLVGQAVYLGPTFYIALGQGASLSGAWNIQAWGQTTGLDPGLDLAFFERQMFKIRLSIDL